MKQIISLLIFTLGLSSFGADSRIQSNQLILGKKAAGNKTIQFENAAGAANPIIRWNNGSTRLEFSNDGTVFSPIASGAAVDSSDEITNLTLAASVGSSALTIAFKTKAAADASAGDPIKVGFRSATAATGTYSQVSLTSALSIVIPSTKTIGTVSAISNTFYVYLINNAGTLAGAVSMKQFDDGSIQSCSDFTSGNTSTTLYCTSAISSKAIRLVGRVKATEATAGTWATLPSEVSVVPFIGSRTTVGASYATATAQTCNSAAETSFDFTGTTYFDTNSMVSGTTITIPVSGTYHLTANIQFSSSAISASTVNRINIWKNGAFYRAMGEHFHPAAGTAQDTVAGNTYLSLVAGDTLVMKVNHNLGTNVASTTSNKDNWMTIIRVGD